MMDVCNSFLEVFNKETSKWEFVYNFNEPPRYDYSYFCVGYCDYPKLKEPIENYFECIDSEFLYILFKTIENNGDFKGLTAWKGIPENASNKVATEYNHLFHEVRFCSFASTVYLLDLLNFDYDQTFDIYKLHKSQYKRLKHYNYEDVKSKTEKLITFREFLGTTFFQELSSLTSLESPENVRINYFLFDCSWYYDEIIQIEPYFKNNIQSNVQISTDKMKINILNDIILTYFIKKITSEFSEEIVEELENLGNNVRDVFLEHLEKTIPKDKYLEPFSEIEFRFKMLENIVTLGCNKGKVNMSFYRNQYCIEHSWVYKSIKDGMICIREMYSIEVNAMIKLVQEIRNRKNYASLLLNLKEDLNKGY